MHAVSLYPFILSTFLGFVPVDAGADPNWRPEPYVPDEFTLHLWHLDEEAAPFSDASASPLPLRGLLNGAKAGQPSLAGFGSAVNFNHRTGDGSPLHGGVLLASRRLYNGAGDRVPASFKSAGQDGAFTYEALIKLDELPSDDVGSLHCIITMDGEFRTERVFQWYISGSGFMVFTPINSVHRGGGAVATIPTTGPDAINTRDWFHVAVSYNGREGTDNSVALYWTRIQPGLHEASLIGTGSMPADLEPLRGDFAIGNEARHFRGESAPFPGLIDEVRLSSRARHPSDFCFVPPEHRVSDIASDGNGPRSNGPLLVQLLALSVDGKRLEPPAPGEALELESGLHRFDFEFEVEPDDLPSPPRVRWQLSGFEQRWEERGQGMALEVEVLDRDGEVLSNASFPALGSSLGWDTALEMSSYAERREPIVIEEGGYELRVRLDSGLPDTTGVFVIGDLDIIYRPAGGKAESLWFNQQFSEGLQMIAQHGIPEGWERGGLDPAIARVRMMGSVKEKGLAVVDGSQSSSAYWVATGRIPEGIPSGSMVMIEWREIYNVIGGRGRRASYLNVAQGSYTFRAIAATADGASAAELVVPIVVKAPFWTSPWYWALVGTLAAALVGGIIISLYSRRNRLRLRALRLRNALAEDRARIARDMHDDLGTRISVLTMNSEMAERYLDSDLDRSRSYLHRMKVAARNLVSAMDDLVWSVNPSNDKLKQFGTFLARTAKEVFRDTPIRWRLEIPTELPDVTLHSEQRHHLALTLKECCHNVLRHSGASEVRLGLRYEDSQLWVEVTDNGQGFDPDAPRDGNGVSNMKRRMEEVGGEFEVTSEPDHGTTVRFGCRC